MKRTRPTTQRQHNDVVPKEFELTAAVNTGLYEYTNLRKPLHIMNGTCTRNELPPVRPEETENYESRPWAEHSRPQDAAIRGCCCCCCCCCCWGSWGSWGASCWGSISLRGSWGASCWGSIWLRMRDCIMYFLFVMGFMPLSQGQLFLFAQQQSFGF